MHFSIALLSLLVPLSSASFDWRAKHSHSHVSVKRSPQGSTCTVKALGNRTDDVPNILTAFKQCGQGGKIVFPESENYWIGQRLNPVVWNVELEWRGIWTFSDDLNYWRNNSYPIQFQNHKAGFVLTGQGIYLDGHGTGAIHGNGDTWYTAEAGTTLPGRPMPFVLWNVSNVEVNDFQILQPPLWALNIMNGTNLHFKNITCNATAFSAPYGKNWVQNTDGFDTMDVHNATLDGFTYQGGDDCIAIKPRSFGITVKNVLCRGGNGIAIGSLGQYLEDASVEDVVVENVKIVRYNEDMHNAAYIKTWIGELVPQSGYESAGQPRGGGTGIVKNLTFRNFEIQGADGGPAITQDNGNNGSFSGTSKLEISNVLFKNFTGWTQGTRKASVSCSNVHPCHDIVFEDINLTVGNTTTVGTESCKYIAPGGVKGLNGTGCT